jgi:cytochrome c oxidase cbb3-type subunit 4
VSSLADYFETDWGAMTPADWVGTILTVVIFVLMAIAYFYVFWPKNRDKLEAKKYIPFQDDNEDLGEHDGRP